MARNIASEKLIVLTFSIKAASMDGMPNEIWPNQYIGKIVANISAAILGNR